MAFGSTETLSRNALERLIPSLIKKARLAKRNEPIVLSERSTVETTWITPVRLNFETVSKDEKNRFVEASG